MDLDNQICTREEAKTVMESNVELSLITIGFMLESKGRGDLDKKIKDLDWRFIPDIKNIIKEAITPEEDKGSEEYEEMADSYETLLMFHMGVLPSSYEEIPVVLNNLRKRVGSKKRKDLDELQEYYDSETGESILDFISKCSEMVVHSHPIVKRSLFECWSITQESVMPVRDIDEESSTMCILTC